MASMNNLLKEVLMLVTFPLVGKRLSLSLCANLDKRFMPPEYMLHFMAGILGKAFPFELGAAKGISDILLVNAPCVMRCQFPLSVS